MAKFKDDEIMKAVLESQKVMDEMRVPLPHYCYLNGEMYKLTWRKVKALEEGE